MPSNKDTKKKLPEILDKFASNSEKATKQLGEMSSQLSAFVDMLSENVQKESRRKDTEDRRRDKARAARAQRDADRAVEIATKDAERKTNKDKKDADAAATELKTAQNEYAEAVKGLAQLDKDEIRNSRQKEIAGLKEKGTPYSDIANTSFASGDILGGLFASIFARKESPDKKRLADLQKQEKDYTEQEEARTKEDTRTQAKKKLQESVTKLQGSVQPAASVSPSKIANPEDQVIAETVKLNDEDKVKQTQEQTKKLGTLDDNISRIWTDHLQVTIADISDPAIDKLKKAIGGGAPGAGAGLDDILSSFGKLAKIGTWIAEFGAVLASPVVLGIGGSLAAVAALIYGFRKNQEDLAKNLQEIQKQRDKDLQDLTEKNAKQKLVSETQRQNSQQTQIYKPSNTGYYQPQIPGRAEEAAKVEIDRKFQVIAREKYKNIQNVPTEVLQQYVSSDKAKVAAFDKAGMFGKKSISTGEYNIAKSKLSANESELKRRNTPTPTPTPAAPTPTPAAAAPTPKPTAVATKQDKINLVANKARKVEQTTGGLLPKELLMTQYMLESGRGKSDTAFGLKATKSYIDKGGKVDTRATWEEFTQDQINEQTQKGYKVLDTPTPTGRKTAKGQDIFKVHLEQPFVGGGLENQIDEYVKLMTGKRYVKALNTYKVDHDLPALFKNIKDAGYATDSGYTAKLTNMQPEIAKLFSEPGSSTPQLLASTPQTGVNVVAAIQDKAAAAGGNTVTIAQSNTVVGGAKSRDGLAYLDPRDYIRKAFNQDIFGIVARSSAT